MPARNDARRAVLADAAMTLLARDGAHGLTHRAVERAAGVPTGTVSNYFPSRDALFAGVADRVGDLHAAAMDAELTPTRGPTDRVLTELLVASLLSAATRDRERYLAIFELQAESLRRPTLVPALHAMQAAVMSATRDHHRALELAVPADAVPVLMELYGALLHSLLLRPPGTVDRAVVAPLVEVVVRGVLG